MMRYRWLPLSLRAAARTVTVLALAGLIVAVAAEKSPFSKKDKAFYLTPIEQSFIRPGLGFQILEAQIEADGTIWYRFTLTDAAGQPLDRNGVFTPGPVRVRSVAAFIPSAGSPYTAYTTSQQTSPGSGQTAAQASFDATGQYEQVGDGEYIYTFGTKASAGFDRTATHTIAAWTQRDLTEFDLGTPGSSATYNFVPDGSAVTVVRDIVPDAACNQCHGSLQAHDQRRGVALCITCHTPQSTDPDSGNTVDMTTMIHKIHMGAELPSVQAGEPYQIIGFGQSVHDFSTVEYPADVRNCQTCHRGVEAGSETAQALEAARVAHSRQAPRMRAAQPSPSQATQANNYLTKPSQRACGSCHDNVNFATGENHADLPQVSDNQCTNCHIPEGELEFDVSIVGAHTVERFSKELPGTNFAIVGVENTSPGENPTVEFAITNDAGNAVPPSQMGRLALVMAGNTNDFSRFISESATGAEVQGNRFFYTFEAPLPEDASGSWAVGIEGYQNATLLAGTNQERMVRDAGDNKVFYFGVTDSQARPRRAVVAQDKCDSCHFDLDVHGSNRNSVEHCVLCHSPNLTDEVRRSAETLPAQGVNFKDMIHKIHTGEELEIDFTVYGFGGTPTNFNEVRFPNDRRNCDVCHIAGTEELPLTAAALPSVNPRGFIDPTPPVSAACLSCHTSMSAAAHADLQTSPNLGESCNVCHGPNAEFSITRVHAQ